MNINPEPNPLVYTLNAGISKDFSLACGSWESGKKDADIIGDLWHQLYALGPNHSLF
jgi:hypothetical protein